MDEISRLIQEAKPLYFARKKRNNRIKASFAMFACVVMISFFYPQRTSINYEEWLFDNEYDELYIIGSYSDIEDMGLPTDEYGFLRLS